MVTSMEEKMGSILYTIPIDGGYEYRIIHSVDTIYLVRLVVPEGYKFPLESFFEFTKLPHQAERPGPGFLNIFDVKDGQDLDEEIDKAIDEIFPLLKALQVLEGWSEKEEQNSILITKAIAVYNQYKPSKVPVNPNYQFTKVYYEALEKKMFSDAFGRDELDDFFNRFYDPPYGEYSNTNFSNPPKDIDLEKLGKLFDSIKNDSPSKFPIFGFDSMGDTPYDGKKAGYDPYAYTYNFGTFKIPAEKLNYRPIQTVRHVLKTYGLDGAVEVFKCWLEITKDEQEIDEGWSRTKEEIETILGL